MSSLESGRASIERRSVSPEADKGHRNSAKGVLNPRIGLINTDERRPPTQEAASVTQRFASDDDETLCRAREDSRARAGGGFTHQQRIIIKTHALRPRLWIQPPSRRTER